MSVFIYDKTNTKGILEATYNDLSFNRIYDLIFYYDCKKHPDSEEPSCVYGTCRHREESETFAYILFVLLDRYKDITGDNTNVSVDIDYIDDDLYKIYLQEE